MTDPAIVLDHYDLGPIRVAVWDEATLWMRRRQWTCPDDPERGTFEDGDFMEVVGEVVGVMDLLEEMGRRDGIIDSGVEKYFEKDEIKINTKAYFVSLSLSFLPYLYLSFINVETVGCANHRDGWT